MLRMQVETGCEVSSVQHDTEGSYGCGVAPLLYSPWPVSRRIIMELWYSRIAEIFLIRTDYVCSASDADIVSSKH